MYNHPVFVFFHVFGKINQVPTSEIGYNHYLLLTPINNESNILALSIFFCDASSKTQEYLINLRSVLHEHADLAFPIVSTPKMDWMSKYMQPGEMVIEAKAPYRKRECVAARGTSTKQFSEGRKKLTPNDYKAELLYLAFYIRRMLFGLEADDEWLKTAMDEILMIEKPLKWDKFRNSNGWVIGFKKRFRISSHKQKGYPNLPKTTTGAKVSPLASSGITTATASSLPQIWFFPCSLHISHGSGAC